MPSILRTSGDTPTADTQNGRKFTVYFLTWPGSVILNVAAPHTWHYTCSESLLDLLWQSEAKLKRPWVPFLHANIEEAALLYICSTQLALLNTAMTKDKIYLNEGFHRNERIWHQHSAQKASFFLFTSSVKPSWKSPSKFTWRHSNDISKLNHTVI